MMVMNNNTPSILVAIHPLASFAFSVLKPILLKCTKEITNRNIFKFMNHKDTATAGSSMTSKLSDGAGIPSPESIMSSI